MNEWVLKGMNKDERRWISTGQNKSTNQNLVFFLIKLDQSRTKTMSQIVKTVSNSEVRRKGVVCVVRN